jgi:hypothetical protein
MNRKDITRMCSQAIGETKGVDSPLFRFAALVAAAEREACAQICDDHADDPVYCGQAIRARGQDE